MKPILICLLFFLSFPGCLANQSAKNVNEKIRTYQERVEGKNAVIALVRGQDFNTGEDYNAPAFENNRFTVYEIIVRKFDTNELYGLYSLPSLIKSDIPQPLSFFKLAFNLPQGKYYIHSVIWLDREEYKQKTYLLNNNIVFELKGENEIVFIGTFLIQTLNHIKNEFEIVSLNKKQNSILETIAQEIRFKTKSLVAEDKKTLRLKTLWNNFKITPLFTLLYFYEAFHDTKWGNLAKHLLFTSKSDPDYLEMQSLFNQLESYR
jgi:hypothetical protein